MRRLSDIDFRLLRVFKAVVDAGGLVGAQASLNLSQSTVSTQLAELEKRLGFRLCHRGRAGFALTKAGQRIHDACIDLFAAVDRFQNTAASISGELKGVLRLGTVDAIATNAFWDLSRLLAAFSERAPSAVIEVFVDSPIDVERLVIEGTRDLTIGPVSRPVAGLVYVPLFRERHALYCAAGHGLAGRARVPAAQVRREPFVARRYLQRLDLQRFGQMRPAAIVEHMEAQAVLIRSGRFIGYLPVHYAEGFRDGGLCRVDTEEPGDFFSPFFLIHRSGAEENLLVRAFLNRVAERAPPPGAPGGDVLGPE